VSRIAVIGAGAWGTALAIVLGRSGRHEVRLWAYEAEVCASLAERRVNEKFLPGHEMPSSVIAGNDLSVALLGADIVLSVMPSHHVRGLFAQMASMLPQETPIVSATKGIEDGTYLTMSALICEVLREKAGYSPQIAVLSGPSFAREVARGDPTAVTVAAGSVELAARVQLEFGDPRFRVYTNEDVIGVELGGALKNIIAIAAGVVEGIGFGHNSAAGLITRGLAEITRLAVACGGRKETLAGLSGMGDLVLTCTGDLSRNRTVGVELGRGRKLPEILAGMRGMVAEGVRTTKAAIGLAQRYGIEMPITEQMHAILNEDKAPAQAIRELMSRPGKVE
jgi:glycerol-3-phosphate dehydrogenase (NAD(P)+)